MTHKRWELVRYVLNGLLATAVHFGAAWLCLQLFAFRWASVANFVGVTMGISISFIGNRYFVFVQRASPWLQQLTRFALLYGVIAVIHVSILFVWADIGGGGFNTGFLLATCVQFLCSYWGNRNIVFAQ